MSNTHKHLRAIAAGTVLALGAAMAPAMATPVYEVTPNSLPGVTKTAFDADFVNGGSSAQVSLISSAGGVYTYQSVGYITYGQFMLSGSPITAFTSGLGSEYGLYATFTQTFTCSSMLSVGTTCSVSTISLSLYADIWGSAANIDTYTAATLSNVAYVTDNGGNDVLLATANVVVAGLAGINALGGAFENVTTNLILTAAGEAYFTDPDPFYTLTYNNFNNTSQGITCSPNCAAATTVAIVSENGGSDFNNVPEPASLALAGLGLLGMGSLRRRKSA